MSDLPSIMLEAIREQKAVLFLGAGASIGATHPTGRKVPSGQQLRDLICDKYCGGKLKERPLIEVAALAANDAGNTNFQLFLREVFEPFGPAAHHLLIPDFRWHSIVTTNFDLIIEKAYEQSKGSLQNLVIRMKDGDQFDSRMNATANPLGYFKLHGCINHYADDDIPLIVSSEQYATFGNNRTLMYSRFHELSLQYTIIFAGYSLQDAHIQKFIFDTAGAAKSRPMFFRVAPNPNYSSKG